MKLSGIVIEGDGYGKKLGFPTANIDRDVYQTQDLDIEYGVYAGWVSAEMWDEPKRAGIVVGPDDAWGLPKLEAHILNFDEDLYGEKLSFDLVEFIRPYQHYQSEAELKTAIDDDIARIKKINLCLPE